MDTLVSWTGLSSLGREFIFLTADCPSQRRLRGSARSLPPTFSIPSPPTHTLKLLLLAAASTNYSLWQLICFCSQLQIPRRKCQSARADAHHIISLRQRPAEKNISIRHCRENNNNNNSNNKVSYCLVAVNVDVWGDGVDLVTGAVLPSGQNTPKAIEREKRLIPLSFFDRITPKP